MQEFSQCVAFNLKAFYGGLADPLVKARALVGRQRLSCKSFFVITPTSNVLLSLISITTEITPRLGKYA
jgi:hypothetical protein